MKKVVRLGKNKDIDKDIELCWTVSAHTSDAAARLLIDNSIPFTKNWVGIPFFLRDRFHGARQMCVISTNPNRYCQARRAIDQLAPVYRRRLLLSNY